MLTRDILSQRIVTKKVSTLNGMKISILTISTSHKTSLVRLTKIKEDVFQNLIDNNDYIMQLSNYDGDYTIMDNDKLVG